MIGYKNDFKVKIKILLLTVYKDCKCKENKINKLWAENIIMEHLYE